MPFTPAHSAIVLPLIRSRFFSATGLIVGSVAPDFEYFFKMSVESHHSHTIAGLFYFDLPVTLGLSFVFHLIVKTNLLLNLPSFLQVRFQSLLVFDFVRYFRQYYWTFILSALTGAASHILWDSFTHGKGYFARNLWFYKGTYVPFDGVDYPLFYALQHISTVIGLLVVVLYVAMKKREQSVLRKRPDPRYWVLFISIVTACFFARFYFTNEDYALGNAVVTLISGMCVALIVCGLRPYRKLNY